MTSIHLERRESARNRQRFYTIPSSQNAVRLLGDGPGVGSDRAAGHGQGNVV